MDFENVIAALGKELSAKYPIVIKRGIKVNENERRLELITEIQLITRKTMEDIANGRFPSFDTIVLKDWENCVFDGRIISNSFLFQDSQTAADGPNEHAQVVTTDLQQNDPLQPHNLSRAFRELYYNNLQMFKSQEQVDRMMKAVCHILGAPTWELRVLATSKGVVAGPVVLTLANGEFLDCSKQGGVAVPQNVLEVEEISTSATWVLIVEKDASFQKLAAADAANRLGSCILLTGKGFPDVNSRILVSKFWQLLRIPILALVDADPHGFEIMCVYRFGSLAMLPQSEHLACPAVRWLGVHPGDIRPLILDSKALSLNDLAKIHSLLKRSYVKANENLKTQLEILLEGNVKAEIEAVTSISTNYMTDVYIRNKIRCKEYF